MKRIPSPPNFEDLMAEHAKDLPKIFGASPVTENGKYLHYDELRHRPVPQGLTLGLWWLGMKFARKTSMTQLPLTDSAGRNFQFAMTAPNYEILHEIDSKGAGRIAMPEQVSKSGPKERFLIRSLVEEAITSSQLEGASTTRKAALDMFRTGRKPINKAERMILNNWFGMSFIKKNKDKELTPEFVFELHSQMTKDTLDPEHVGRLQTPEDERIHVGSNQTGEILHQPPPAEQLPGRLQAMCDFANGLNETEFLHPVISAIILHLWLAYDHPFEDGNGRTARALFYWSMLKRKYWLFEFISISAILKKAQAQYARSFLYTESDENDATYFITYQLGVIQAALRAAEQHLERQAKRIAETEAKLKGQGHFNYRQLALLSHALRKPHSEYTVQSHRSSHDVSKGTARTDLQELVKHGLLVEFYPEGERMVIYRPTKKLAKV